MDLNHFDVKRTGLLFFDILNGYYHQAGTEAKARKKPMVENAVRLMRAARQAPLPIFFAKGNHRADYATVGFILTDTKLDLKAWPNGEVAGETPVAVQGNSGSDVIPELDPQPNDYDIPKYRWMPAPAPAPARSSTAGPSRCSDSTAVSSAIRTPRRRHAARNPQASRAGSTSAARSRCQPPAR